PFLYSLLVFCILFSSCKKEKTTNTKNEIESETETVSKPINNSKTKAETPIVFSKINSIKTEVKITPINHGTMVLEYNNVVLYIDPVGGADAFLDQKKPTLILITDIHGDHLDLNTLKAITTKTSRIIAPIAVAEKLPEALNKAISVISNFQSIDLQIGNSKIAIEAIPMYNLRKEALKYHPKDRGNGYVITLGTERIYISGDTEDIPEMRNLKNIDIAFVCMNLPYTMPIESAANAVLDFKPKYVLPYHYRGTNGFSDVNLFKNLVLDKNKNIKVIPLNWYPEAALAN
ncbi:MAG: MBL fold metallo-hydrolase, partial [Oceanihabitans sp.]